MSSQFIPNAEKQTFFCWWFQSEFGWVGKYVLLWVMRTDPLKRTSVVWSLDRVAGAPWRLDPIWKAKMATQRWVLMLMTMKMIVSCFQLKASSLQCFIRSGGLWEETDAGIWQRCLSQVRFWRNNCGGGRGSPWHLKKQRSGRIEIHSGGDDCCASQLCICYSPRSGRNC